VAARADDMADESASSSAANDGLQLRLFVQHRGVGSIGCVRLLEQEAGKVSFADLRSRMQEQLADRLPPAYEFLLNGEPVPSEREAHNIVAPTWGADACVCIGTVPWAASPRADIKSARPNSVGAVGGTGAFADAAVRASFGRRSSPCLGRSASSPASSSKSGPRPAPPRVQRLLDTFSNLFPQEQREAFHRLAVAYPALLADHVRSRPPPGDLPPHPPSPSRTNRVVRAPTHRRAPVLFPPQQAALEPPRAPEIQAPPGPPEHAPPSLEQQLRQMFDATKPKRPIRQPEMRAVSASPTPPPGASPQRPQSAPRLRPRAQPAQPSSLTGRPSPRTLAAALADAAVSTPPRRSTHASANSTPGTDSRLTGQTDETAGGGGWAGGNPSSHAPLRSHPSALPFHRSAQWRSERKPAVSPPAGIKPAWPPHKAKPISPAAIRALHQAGTISSYLRLLQRRESPQRTRPDMSFDQAGAHASSVHNLWLAGLRPSNNSPLPANARHGRHASRADWSAVSPG
jgi:hypothetical protein